jgi:nitrogenase molybdenum-iron protein NifN
LGLKQGALSSGGISVEEIKALGSSSLVVSIGRSVKKAGEKLHEKNPNMQHLHFESLAGLQQSDKLFKALCEIKNISTPHPSIVRWRKRLQDALLDTHFLIGNAKVIIALEPDQAYSIAQTILEAGATIHAIVSPCKSELLDSIGCENLIIGDFEDVEHYLKQSDVLISNFHGERIAHNLHKKIMLRGFPDYESVGNQLKNDVLYEGSSYFLFELANMLQEHHTY